MLTRNYYEIQSKATVIALHVPIKAHEVINDVFWVADPYHWYRLYSLLSIKPIFQSQLDDFLIPGVWLRWFFGCLLNDLLWWWLLPAHLYGSSHHLALALILIFIVVWVRIRTLRKEIRRSLHRLLKGHLHYLFFFELSIRVLKDLSLLFFGILLVILHAFSEGYLHVSFAISLELLPRRQYCIQNVILGRGRMALVLPHAS